MIYPRTLMSDRELEFLIRTVGGNKTVVEVGCYIGRTTIALAEFNRVIAIDPFIPNYNPEEELAQYIEGAEKVFEESIKGHNVEWYKRTSEDVLRSWTEPIDGVLIDGDHSGASVKIDLGWIPFVKVGGIVAFHDYGLWRGVYDTVNRYVKGVNEHMGLIELVENLIIFRKVEI